MNEIILSTYEVCHSGPNPRIETRHMASDGVLSAAGDTAEDAYSMLRIVQRRRRA